MKLVVSPWVFCSSSPFFSFIPYFSRLLLPVPFFSFFFSCGICYCCGRKERVSRIGKGCALKVNLLPSFLPDFSHLLPPSPPIPSPPFPPPTRSSAGVGGAQSGGGGVRGCGVGGCLEVSHTLTEESGKRRTTHPQVGRSCRAGEVSCLLVMRSECKESIWCCQKGVSKRGNTSGSALSFACKEGRGHRFPPFQSPRLKGRRPPTTATGPESIGQGSECEH